MSVYRVGGNKSSQNIFPSVRPTLDLDFANSKTLDPRITFTRSSGGSYVGADGLIKYAGVNEARFDHDPVTGESLGLLVEEARTNSNTFSEDMNSWIKTGVTINENVIVSPDGNQTADEILCNLTGGFNGRVTRVMSIGNNYYTISFYAKKGNTDWLMITIEMGGAGGRRCWYNLNTGKIGANTPAFGGVWDFETRMEGVGNGWYRCSITVNVTTGSGALSYFAMCPNDNLSATSNSGNSIYIWGAQLEAGAFPTSYIPTQASTRTRAADTASITGKNFSEWYRQDEGTIYGEFIIPYQFSSNFVRVFEIKDDICDMAFSLQTFLPTLLRYYHRNINDTINIPIATFNFTIGKKNKTAYATDGTRTSTTMNSQIVEIFNTPLLMPKFTDNPILNIGGRVASGDRLNGTISRLTYFPKRLPNEQLRALTR